VKLYAVEEIIPLLQLLSEKQADELEGQHLDTRTWSNIPILLVFEKDRI